MVGAGCPAWLCQMMPNSFFTISHNWQTRSEILPYTAIYSLQSKCSMSSSAIYRSKWKSAWQVNTTTPRVTGRIWRHQKLIPGCQSPWRCFGTVALQAGSLADIPHCPVCYVPWPTLSTKLIHFFLPHDKLPRSRKVTKYALTVVDIASRYKEA